MGEAPVLSIRDNLLLIPGHETSEKDTACELSHDKQFPYS